MAVDKPLLKEKDKPRAQRKIGISGYKKKLDKVFSEYIRRRNADIEGMTVCYTCGVKKHYKELQCGHFAPRQYTALRYDEINCQTQCYACNMLYNGQPSAFAMRLKRDYGENIIERLEARRKEVVKLYPYELKLEEYKEKLKNL
jgi:hypothetical protein